MRINGADVEQPVRQVTYRSALAGVQHLPDGQVLLIMNVPELREALVFPMPEKVAKELGGQLMSARVHVAGGLPA